MTGALFFDVARSRGSAAGGARRKKSILRAGNGSTGAQLFGVARPHRRTAACARRKVAVRGACGGDSGAALFGVTRSGGRAADGARGAERVVGAFCRSAGAGLLGVTGAGRGAADRSSRLETSVWVLTNTPRGLAAAEHHDQSGCRSLPSARTASRCKVSHSGPRLSVDAESEAGSGPKRSPQSFAAATCFRSAFNASSTPPRSPRPRMKSMNEPSATTRVPYSAIVVLGSSA